MTRILDQVSILDETRHSVPEHETVVSWVSDELNAAFNEWLELEGLKDFEIYYHMNCVVNEEE